MKNRYGFVSNSSSTSFVCDFCGTDVGGRDMSLCESGMFECDNGHTICRDHLNEAKWLSEEIFQSVLVDLKKELKRKNEEVCFDGKSSDKEKIQDFVQSGKKSAEELIDFWISTMYNEYDVGVDPKMCPVCQFQKLLSSDGLKYLIKTKNVSETEIIDEVTKRFSTYKEFENFLEGESK